MSLSSGQAFQLAKLSCGQRADDWIVIIAKELGRAVVRIAEDLMREYLRFRLEDPGWGVSCELQACFNDAVPLRKTVLRMRPLDNS
jgi:hypothetical protein